MITTATDLFRRHEDDLALNILWSAAIQSWWSDQGEIGQQIVAAAEVGAVDKHDPRLLAVCAFAAPAGRGAMVVDQLSSLGSEATTDPDLARVLATAANAVGAFTASSGMLAASAAGLRRQGRLGLLARTLMQQAWSAAERADISVAIPVAEEAARLTRETKQPTIHYTVRAIQATLAALRGDRSQAEAHSADAEAFALARGARALLMLARHASGRGQLAFGEWLRRRRRPADARGHLRAARDTFDALGTIPWSERARHELRASGETSRQRMPEARDQLTPQELQIAQLAAKGLTNREIGQMLYLSHRTISSHLYRAFPKLGVSSRAELRGVLERGLFEAG